MVTNMINKTFKNEDFGIELTSYIDYKQNIWFLGKDVAEILGYSKTRDALSRHADNEDKQLICCRPQNVDANNNQCCPRETQGQQIKMTLEENITHSLMNLDSILSFYPQN